MYYIPLVNLVYYASKGCAQIFVFIILLHNKYYCNNNTVDILCFSVVLFFCICKFSDLLPPPPNHQVHANHQERQPRGSRTQGHRLHHRAPPPRPELLHPGPPLLNRVKSRMTGLSGGGGHRAKW